MEATSTSFTVSKREMPLFRGSPGVKIGGHSASAFSQVNTKEVNTKEVDTTSNTALEHLTNKKDAFAFIKTLFTSYRVLPETKHKEI
jgi:hypothetical protein